MRTRFLFLLMGLVVSLFLRPGAAQAWWNDDWSLRKPVTVDTSAAGGGITDVIGRTPVLVRLSVGNFKFDAAKPDGSDLRVIAGDDKTPLKFEVEKYDSLLGEAFVWVDVPDLNPGAQTQFYIYYGNAKAPAAAGSAFDADTTLVYHFAEHGVPAKDSSVFNNTAQTVGQSTDGSLIGPGLKLDGTTPVSLPASPSLTWTDGAAMTWSAWVKPTQVQGDAVIFSRTDGANGFAVGLNDGAPYVEITRAGQAQRSATTPTLAANLWHHLAVVATGQAAALYLDGAAVGSVAAALPALNSVAQLGPTPQAATPAPAPAPDTNATTPGSITPEATPSTPATPAVTHVAFVGELDELEISKVTRPAGFVKLAALGEGADGGKLTKLGQDEETSSWSGGYFAVILHSVTLDGWVVIGILMIMAVISWAIMVGKAGYLSRLEKANRRFRETFVKYVSDPTLLAHGEETGVSAYAKHSSLYRVYSIASEELKRRAQTRTGRPRPLTAEALATIRASLDAGQVREVQRMNRQMVLLTLAIAGGPFLGLLGTVIGVMITFAAIAASGDVNVNAIAPGIAAALAATVAGLIVAIPALFGYNWLLTRIRNSSAELQVFVDELLTRTAEAYRRKADLHAEMAAAAAEPAVPAVAGE